MWVWFVFCPLCVLRWNSLSDESADVVVVRQFQWVHDQEARPANDDSVTQPWKETGQTANNTKKEKEKGPQILKKTEQKRNKNWGKNGKLHEMSQK